MVVGKPAATVMTSSPGTRRRSPSLGDVSAEMASRFADEPELVSEHSRTPSQRAKSRSKRSAKRPAVSQKSSAESTSMRISEASKTLPETGTDDSPGTKGRAANFSAQYWPARSRILARNSWVWSIMSVLGLLRIGLPYTIPYLVVNRMLPKVKGLGVTIG